MSTNYKEIGYDNLLERNSLGEIAGDKTNDIDMSNGINSYNADSIITPNSIDFDHLDIDTLHKNEDIESENFNTEDGEEEGWKISGDGELISEIVREIYIPAEAMAPTTTSPCSDLTQVETSSWLINYWVLDFDDTSPEACFFTLRMPDNWYPEKYVKAEIIWTTSGGTAGQTVKWRAYARAYSDGNTIDEDYAQRGEIEDTCIGQNIIHKADTTSNIVMSGAQEAGQWCQFKIARDPTTDNLTGDARLLGVRINYTIA